MMTLKEIRNEIKEAEVTSFFRILLSGNEDSFTLDLWFNSNDYIEVGEFEDEKECIKKAKYLSTKLGCKIEYANC